MRKWTPLTALFITSLILAFGVMGHRVALAQQDPTIPTRTPTPDPNKPSPSPTATTEDPDNPQPTPTNTTEAGGSGTAPTATQSAVIPPASGGSPIPGTGSRPGQAAPPVIPGGTIQANPGVIGSCSDTPYVRAIQRITVYDGPGIDFAPLTTLERDEMRPIIGRAAFAQWWQILVDNQTIGWVSDNEVNEYGNTALVPIAPPPVINGNTPTPGAPWNPTPLPLLTCVPTPTPSATPTATPTAGNDAANNAIAGGTSDSTTPTATLEMVSADITGGPAAQTGNPAMAQEENESGSGISSRGSETARVASPTSMVNLFLPLAGLALIGGGILLALLSRNHGQTKSDQPK